MKKLFVSLTLLSLLSACGTESISTDQINIPDMAPSVSAQAKKNEISTETFSAFVQMKDSMEINGKPSLQVFMKVTKATREYDNSEEMYAPYQVFFDSESIDEYGTLKLGKNGVLYLEHVVRSNAMVIRDPIIEYFRIGTYAKKASVKSGDSVSFKIDAGNAVKMKWKMGEISRQGIEIYLKPGLKEEKAKPELF